MKLFYSLELKYDKFLRFAMSLPFLYRLFSSSIFVCSWNFEIIRWLHVSPFNNRKICVFFWSIKTRDIMMMLIKRRQCMTICDSFVKFRIIHIAWLIEFVRLVFHLMYCIITLSFCILCCVFSLPFHRICVFLRN